MNFKLQREGAYMHELTRHFINQIYKKCIKKKKKGKENMTVDHINTKHISIFLIKATPFRSIYTKTDLKCSPSDLKNKIKILPLFTLLSITLNIGR